MLNGGYLVFITILNVCLMNIYIHLVNNLSNRYNLQTEQKGSGDPRAPT